jgi:hypothetical protein
MIHLVINNLFYGLGGLHCTDYPHLYGQGVYKFHAIDEQTRWEVIRSLCNQSHVDLFYFSPDLEECFHAYSLLPAGGRA